MNDQRVLELGIAIMNTLETGRRESTYKIATLTALTRLAIESDPQDADAPKSVDLEDLADRVIALYWSQLEPFDEHGYLLQTQQGNGDIFKRMEMLQSGIDLAARSRGRFENHPLYPRARRSVAQLLAQMPLTHLQHDERGRPMTPFLFDDSALRKKMTIAELDQIRWKIELLPGVAWALAKLSPLLLPTLEGFWEAEVRRFNRNRGLEDRLADYLFGTHRTMLAHVAGPLTELQNGLCFYCGTRLREATHVDHVLPWSRTSLDDLSNLVAADETCNLSKSATLPVADFTVRAAAREGLQEVAKDTALTVRPERTLKLAMGLTRMSPDGVRMWQAPSQCLTLDESIRDSEIALLQSQLAALTSGNLADQQL